MYDKQTDFEFKLIEFEHRVSYIVGPMLVGKKNANAAYKEIKQLFEEVKKFRKHEKREDNLLDYDETP
jgi:hypothetical protein